MKEIRNAQHLSEMPNTPLKVGVRNLVISLKQLKRIESGDVPPQLCFLAHDEGDALSEISGPFERLESENGRAPLRRGDDSG